MMDAATEDRYLLSPTVDKLFKEPAPPVSAAEAHDLAVEFFGLDPYSVEPLPGERDRNFRVVDGEGAQFAMRVLHPAEAPEATAFQTMALRHIAEADPSLPIPRALLPVDGREDDPVWRQAGAPPRRLRCLTWVEGVTVLDAGATAAQRWALGDFLARIDAALADFRHPGESHDLVWDLKRGPRARVLLPWIPDQHRRGLAQRGLDRIAALETTLGSLRQQPLHNDFNPHNVLVDPEDPRRIAGVIDFGDMVRGPLVQDVATACAYQVSSSDRHPLQGPAEIVAGFHSHTSLQEPEIELLPQLITGRLALAGAVAAWRAQLHPDNADYIHRNVRRVWDELEALEELDNDAAVSWLRDRIGERP